MTTWVKLCGITRPEDAEAATAAGADAIGVNLWPRSKRFVAIGRAAAIAAAAGRHVLRVGVFVDPEPEEVDAAIEAIGLGAIQLHGHEPPELRARWSVPVIKAISAVSETEAAGAAMAWEGCRILLDADAGAERGGTGRRFDWAIAAKVPRERLILAGGLDPGNVREAVERVHPWGVDVASGVESSPGVKDARKMEEFVRNAKAP